MTHPTIAVLEPGYAAYDTETRVLAAHDAKIAPIGADVPAVPALQALDPVALLVRERIVDAAVLDACPNLQVVVRYGVGVDNIDLDHARTRGIKVANVPDYGAEHEVSEHAVALYLAVQRRILSRDTEVRDGAWGIGQAAMIPSRAGSVLGLIGCGKIGLKAAEKFRALGFEAVLVFDPYLPTEAAANAGVELATLEDLCRRADVVSLHAPLTPETRHILNAERIALMKPTSIVINVSRGGLVEEAALANALGEGRLFGAGIDVFEVEPVAQDNPLLRAPNTLLSDHAAWYSERSVEVLQRNAATEIARVLSGEAPRNWVNPW
ncbi:C-terminal binding protein [Tropicibacter sp. R16_0]|uniref:C-terminal binding protein n=1 Tax=Tropicibacter sp. R16_0 TaxID=2821102 RepID=UPI001ADC88CA|nr:C-terminal binding protein [Tropicibacter sp. R16_0]MBO9451161.1 C-terminal binding protein [Tropicibacter sp. R16_0]